MRHLIRRQLQRNFGYAAPLHSLDANIDLRCTDVNQITNLWQAAQFTEDQSAQSVGLVVRQLQFKILVDIRDQQITAQVNSSIFIRRNERQLMVKFVLKFTEDLFN